MHVDRCARTHTKSQRPWALAPQGREGQSPPKSPAPRALPTATLLGRPGLWLPAVASGLVGPVFGCCVGGRGHSRSPTRKLRRWPPGSAGRRDSDPAAGQGERAHSPLIGNAVFSSEAKRRHEMWERPKGRGMPRCQAHPSDSWRGGPAGRGLGAQAQSGLATGRSPAGGACGGTGRRGPGRSLSSDPPPCCSWTRVPPGPRWLCCWHTPRSSNGSSSNPGLFAVTSWLKVPQGPVVL